MTNDPSKEQMLSLDPKAKKAAFEAFYHKNFKKIEQLVLQNSGNMSDAEDLFQECMIILYKNLQKDDFHGTGSLDSYFYGICKRTWLNQLKKRQQSEKAAAGFQEELVTEEELPLWKQNKHVNDLSKLLEKVSGKCKSVLVDFYFYNMTVHEIMEKYNLGSLGAAKNKKYRCMQQLIAYSKNIVNS